MDANRAIYVLRTASRIVVPLGAAALATYLLYRYEYFTELGAVDNVIGAMPIAFMLVFVACAATLANIRYCKRFIALYVAIAVFAVLSLALFPNALRGNWWFGKYDSSIGSDGDVSQYAPFTDNNKTAKLGEPSTLRLDGDLPVLDGALALYPVYSAIAETVYDESAFTEDRVMFTNTLRAFDAVVAGECDIAFLAGASKAQTAKAKAAGADMRFTPIGREAFVFLASAQSPVDGLTVRQVRNVYSGKTSTWRTLGWAEGGDILAFQRHKSSGSQSGLEKVMRGLPIAAPRPLPDPSIIGNNSLMEQITVEWKGVQPALGFSYKFFAETMKPNPGAKMLKINGIAPTADNIKSGSYPFTVEFYAVTNGEPRGNTKLLIDWLLSPQGQKLIELCGYTGI